MDKERQKQIRAMVKDLRELDATSLTLLQAGIDMLKVRCALEQTKKDKVQNIV